MNVLLALGIAIIAHLSYYDPALCGVLPINCFDPARWWHMAAGHDAREWYGKALACPQEFPIGSRWRLPAVRGDSGYPAQDWICLDRGGMVVTEIDGSGAIRVVLDLLSPSAIVSDSVRVLYVGPLPEELLSRFEAMRSERRR